MKGSDICPRHSSTLHELLDPHPHRGTDSGSQTSWLWKKRPSFERIKSQGIPPDIREDIDSRRSIRSSGRYWLILKLFYSSLDDLLATPSRPSRDSRLDHHHRFTYAFSISTKTTLLLTIFAFLKWDDRASHSSLVFTDVNVWRISSCIAVSHSVGRWCRD